MMGTEEEAGSDVIANSGPLGAAKKNTIFNLPDSHEEEAHAQVTIDVQSVNKTSDEEDNESTLLAESGKGLHISSSFGVTSTSVTQCRSTRIKDKLKHLTSFSKREPRPSLGHMDRTAVAQALKGLNFIGKADTGDAAGWLAVEKQFEAITRATASDEDARLPRSRFGECIGMTKESKTFAGQLFDALARKRGIKGDSITKTQLKDFWELISNQSFESRLQTFFAMVDKNGDGKITQEEIKEIISLSASANKLPNIQKQADEYAALIMEEFDPHENGYIMTNKLEMLLFEDPNQSTRGDSKYLSQMLSQKLKPTKGNPCKRCWEDTKYFLQDNWPRIWVMALWVGVMLGLFVYKFKQYRKTDAHKVMGDCVCMAKGAAETLKLNMALILLPVCRNTITWLRNKTKLGVAIPFDDNLNFHMAIAVGITVGTGIHGIYHLACDFPRLIHASKDKYKLMKPFFGEKQPSSYWHFVKGVEGVTGIIMVILMVIAFTLASPWLRRGKFKNLPKPLQKLIGFNAFWYSHHLFIIVYGLYIVHGVCLYLIKVWYKKTTWMYLAVPLVLYACERLIRAFRSSVEHVEIQTVAIYDGDVLTLQMSKPEGFDYQSGQYMFVNCAEVSPFEWHPFSITSAPKDDYLSVHIRIVGDWTGQLKNVFKKVCQQSTGGKSGLLRADCLKENNIPVCPRVKIDGPYGAPAQDYKKYEVILLVGLGIGATPMISIVKDIISNIKDDEEHEMNALEIGNGTRSSSRKSTDNDNFMTKKAYFYWVTREQGSFDWFRSVMNEVVESDHQRVIELHNYCTCVYEEGDARSAFIAMLQSLTHAKNGVDIVSGTRVKSHFSKPNWRSVYKRVALNHPHARVGVFYCGQPGLIKNLRQLALDFSHKSTTKFDFHKENF